MMTSAFKTATPLLEIVIKHLLELPGHIKDAGIALGTYLAERFGKTDTQIQQNIDNMGKNFKDLLLVIGTMIAGLMSALVNVVMFAGKIVGNFLKL